MPKFRQYKSTNVRFLQLRSTLAAKDWRLLAFRNKLRFVHIDGYRAAATVANDLTLEKGNG